MDYIGGFEISLFPRYHEGVDSPPVLENLFAQSAMWDALHMLVVCEWKVSVELRIVSDPGSGSIRIFLLLIGQIDRPTLMHDIFHLLPSDYAYQQLGFEELAEITHPVPRSEGWRVARVQRRTQYVDLPSLLESEEERASSGGMACAERTLGFNLPAVENLRHLPENRKDCLTQLDTVRFCLPLLGQLKEFRSDRKQVFEELQVSAPVIVSITLHPYSEMDLEEDRQVATRFRDLLDSADRDHEVADTTNQRLALGARRPTQLLGSALENAGFGDLQSLQRVYDRYFLSQHYISLITIRVAAETNSKTIAAAHRLCSWLGGTRAFVIAPPKKTFSDLSTVLTDLRLELPSGKQSADWDKKLTRLHQSLRADQIQPVQDSRYGRFLVRLPHVYTLEEVGQVMRLPFGLEAGLPGLVTRMRPPFNPSSQRYDPVVDSTGQYQAPQPDRIRIGRVNPSSSLTVKGSEAGLHWHSIPVRDLTKHALVVGSTGSGKTVTSQFLMRELLRLQVPFLVIEPVKTEYYDALRQIGGVLEGPNSLKRYNFEGNERGKMGSDFLAFDPMRLQEGVTVARHVSYLKTCFEAAFPMDSWQALLLQNAMLEYYTDNSGRGCGLQLFSRGGPKCLRRVQAAAGQPGRVYPSFATFSSYFLEYFLDKEFKRTQSTGAVDGKDMIETMRQIFKRRFRSISMGPLGQAFSLADHHVLTVPKFWFESFGYLLTRPTVLELDAIPDGEQKSLAMAFLMTFLYERRQVNDLLEREAAAKGQAPAKAGPLRHVLVIEEAHRLLANPQEGGRGELAGMGSQAKAVSLFVDMLAEIRAFRQGLVIVEQIPTKLVPAALKNTNLKIMLRITSREDRDYLGEAMSFNEEQKRFVSFLRAEPPIGDSPSGATGQVQFVAFDENVEEPILLTLPLRSGQDGQRWLFDEYFNPQP